MPHTLDQCQECGADIAILRKPLRRLRWTRYWWVGLSSLGSQPLRFCPDCGALYGPRGNLLAKAVVETTTESKQRRFRDDMVGLRDGFGTVVVASGMTIGWTVFGPVTYDVAVAVWAAALGGASMLPFGYFARKAQKAKKELKRLRTVRIRGELDG